MKTIGKINETHGEKTMKTMEKTMKTIDKMMRINDFSSNMQQSACFSSKTQPIARKSAADRQNQ